ncbi:MAG: right-handed parallel beta-helix repeat-containing protein, partial [Acidobacteriota bacterium]
RPGTVRTNIPITLNQPGYYYLIHNLESSSTGSDGITVDANDITIDMNGFTLFGGKFTGLSNSDDGIFVSGSHTNIKIYNGGVAGWHGDGINALNADFSIFRDLYVGQNNGDGLVTDFNCLIERVAAFSNGFDGIEGDDGTVIYDCTAGQNGDNGIQSSEGCVVADSASFDNAADGFDIASGSVIQNSVASDNAIFGFDIGLGSQIVESTAYDNMSNGFDMFSACIIRDCIASLNSGHGIRTFANSWVIDNKAHENDLDGIRISSGDVHVEGNQVTDNDQTGLAVTASGCFIVRNTAAGNVTNYNIIATSAFGPIIDVNGDGDISAVAGADHPWANFEF